MQKIVSYIQKLGCGTKYIRYMDTSFLKISKWKSKKIILKEKKKTLIAMH